MNEQIDIWTAIDEADGYVPRTATEIADVLRALTPTGVTRAVFRPSEWTDLMIARRKVSKEDSRHYVVDRRDGEVRCTLTPLVLPLIDLRPGDVLWPYGEVVEAVHRRDGRCRLIARPQGIWSSDWLDGKHHTAHVLTRGKALPR